jgi:RHS repeat-associated protein
VLSSYGSITSSTYRSEADFNRDGSVDAADLAAVLSYAAALPEGTLSSPGIANRTGYCGYRFAPETEMYLARNRWNSPPLGRWIERDPLGYVDGMGLYEYVRGGAVNAADSWGLATLPQSVVSGMISAVFQYLDCGIRICEQDAGKSPDGWRWGHQWLEWWASSRTAAGSPIRRLEAIGYWPKQYYRARYINRRLGSVVAEGFFSEQVGCSSPLPAGASFPNSTLFGPPRSHLTRERPYRGYVPESCGFSDPAARTADTERMTLRRLRAESYCDGTIFTTTPQHLSAGGSQGEPCSKASCEQIVDCLRHVRPRAEYGLLSYNCRDFVDDALRQCCLTKGGRSR